MKVVPIKGFGAELQLGGNGLARRHLVAAAASPVGATAGWDFGCEPHAVTIIATTVSAPIRRE